MAGQLLTGGLHDELSKWRRCMFDSDGTTSVDLALNAESTGGRSSVSEESADDASAFDHELRLVRELWDGGSPRDGVLHYLRVSSEAWHWGRHTAGVWEDFIARAAGLGLLEAFRAEPITARSAAQPRGYAGDAVLLDLIYDFEGANEAAQSKLSCEKAIALNELTFASLETESVRWRRRFIASRMTTLSERQSSLKVLSVASGHARELALLDHATKETLGAVTVLDQDGQSIAQSIVDYGDFVIPHEADISGLIKGQVSVDESYDLVYTLGLLDYLDDKTASVLLSRLAEITAPGGQIVFANFAKHPINIGYMESAMDWKLIYRTEADMDLIWSSTRREDFELEMHRDQSGTVVYAEATRISEVSQ